MSNKNEIVKTIAQKTGKSQKDVANVLDATLDTIIDSLTKGEKIQLVGFGTFEPKKRAARKGRNPQTGEDMEIPASTVPHFKPGKHFKDAINK